MTRAGTRLRRNSLRRPRFDYRAPGAYFVTICTWRRLQVFGRVVNGRMVLNPLGRTVRECWRAIPDHFENVTLGEMVVMPNHVHGIVLIHPRRGDKTAGHRGTDPDGTAGRDGARGPAPRNPPVPVGATHASPLPGVGAPPIHNVPSRPAPGAPSRRGSVAASGVPPGVPSGVPSGAVSGVPFPPFPNPPDDQTGPSPGRRFRGGHGPASASLGAIIGAFKAAAARRVNLARGTPGAPLWQRSYHDAIIRGRHALRRIGWYIRLNPSAWARDRRNPMRRAPSA